MARKSIATQSSINQIGNEPKYAIDGIKTGNFASSKVSNPSWLKLEFKKEYDVLYFKMFFVQGISYTNTHGGYNLYIGNGNTESTMKSDNVNCGRIGMVVQTSPQTVYCPNLIKGKYAWLISDREMRFKIYELQIYAAIK